MELISNELREALVEQWSHEMYNSSIYLTIGAYLKNKGFDSLAKHFEDQRDEERGHADHILKLLTDLNVDFYSPQIDGFNCDRINSIVDIGNLYVEREKITTESLQELKQLAMDDNCGIVEESMRELISRQQAEMDESLTFQDRANIIGNDWKFVLLWDISLG